MQCATPCASAGGISLDQYVAEALGVEALTLAALPRGTNGGCRISYKGADLPVNPFEDPGAAYASLTPSDRKTAHELAARWLSERGEVDPLVLAEHWSRDKASVLVVNPGS